MANSRDKVTATDVEETEAAPAAPMMTPADFMAGIGSAVADAIKAQTRPQVPIGRYDPRTIYHPVKATQSVLKRKCFQNGFLVDHGTTFDKEIDLMNRITRSGTYLDGLVSVNLVVYAGSHEEVVHVNFANKTAEHKLDLKEKGRDFIDILQQIVAKQNEEDEDEEQFGSRRRRA